MDKNSEVQQTERASGAPIGLDGDAGGDPRDAMSSGAYGALLRRVLRAPMRFTFSWRGIDFTGIFETLEKGIRLSLQGDLGSLPYSAEDARARGGLLAIVDTYGDGSSAMLKVVSGQTIVLENAIDLPRSVGGGASNIVTSLTLLVLNTAPFLDLLAEPGRAEPT
ncbi:MAG: hypothetical protein IIA73_11560 [Proteobacteria bacterium]|nr:hypothetical protein [Pseudomonadota bacterium]